MGAEGISRSRVTARDILKAVSEVRRRKHWPLLQELEAAEPDLAEFILEEISAIHHTLLHTGARPKTARRLQMQVQSLALVCVLAPRNAGQSRDDASPATPPSSKENP